MIRQSIRISKMCTIMKSITKPICQTFRMISMTWSTNQKILRNLKKKMLQRLMKWSMLNMWLKPIFSAEHANRTSSQRTNFIYIYTQNVRSSSKFKNLSHWRIHQHSSNSQQKEKTSRTTGLKVEDMSRLWLSLSQKKRMNSYVWTLNASWALWIKNFWWSKRSKLS